MILMCPSCYTLHTYCSNDKALQQRKKCKCDNFKLENMIEIDDFYALIIQGLNLKGYKTKFHCSGHVTTDSTYIIFEDNINKDIVYEYYKFVQRLRNKINKDPENLEKRMKLLYDHSVEVLQWVKSLKMI